MRFAVLDWQQRVENLIVWDTIQPLPDVLDPARLVALEDHDQPEIGSTFSNGQFVPPAP